MNDYMKEYLYTLVEEKGLDLNDTFSLKADGNLNIFEYGVVVEAILSTTEIEQQAIFRKLLMIDFNNGDITHYFRHLAQALI